MFSSFQAVETAESAQTARESPNSPNILSNVWERYCMSEIVIIRKGQGQGQVSKGHYT